MKDPRPVTLANSDPDELTHQGARPEPRRPRWILFVVAGLLATYALMAWTASFKKGVSFDEGLQLAVGYNLWLNADYRMEGGNGDFVRRWATLPYLVTRPKFVSQEDRFWKLGGSYETAYSFFFLCGNSPEALLRQGRAMVVLLGCATGLLIFWWAQKLFGRSGGIIALTLFVFSPHMLAFGGVVSTDMSITLTLFAATYCVWRLLHEVTWGGVLLSLVATSLLVLAKPTALALVPITLGLIGVKFLAGRPLLVRWGNREWLFAGWRSQSAVFALLFILHVAAGWGAIWAHYGFRYTASPNPADPTIVYQTQVYRDKVPAPVARLMRALEAGRVLPEGYLKGIDLILGNDEETGAFQNGEWHVGGRPSFFPYAIWVKTHPTVFILLITGAVMIAWIHWKTRSNTGTARMPGGTSYGFSPVYALTPLFVLIGVYLALAMREGMNIGHRHVLPIYPALYVLAGATALLVKRAGGVARVTLGLLLLWLVADSWRVRPNYLAYFAPQGGGTENGYKRLVDSSLEWGMNLPALREWLDAHDPGQKVPLFFAYFGTDEPAHYGIKATRLQGFPDWQRRLEFSEMTPGYYAISATIFQGVYTAAFGPWSTAYEEMYRATLTNLLAFAATKDDPQKRRELVQRMPPKFWEEQLDTFDSLRLARLCAWLRKKGEPQYHVAHTIFIWKLEEADLRAALLAPPAELVERPGNLRRFRSL